MASDEAKKVVETAVAGKKGEKETKKPAGMNNWIAFSYNVLSRAKN